MKLWPLILLLTGLCALGQTTTIRISTNTPLVQGDQVVWSGSAWIPLNKGTNGQVLTMDGTNVVWATPTGSGGGGLVESVSDDFEVTGGELTLTNALGTGPLVRQSAASGAGTVTSVGLSLPSIFSVSGTPVESSGTLIGTLATQAANRVFAGPTTGADAAPTFRAMVDADVPAEIARTNQMVTLEVDGSPVIYADIVDSPTIEAAIDGGGLLTLGIVSGSVDVAQLDPDLYEQITNRAFDTLTVSNLVLENGFNFTNVLFSNTARLLGRSTAGAGRGEEVSIGSGLSMSGGTLSATGGGGSSVSVDSASVAAPNFLSNYAGRFAIAGSTNISILPQPQATGSASTFTPNFGSTRTHVFTLTNNATLAAPSGVTSDMIGDTFRIVLVQDGTGGRTITTATNYLYGATISELSLSTGAGYRDYVSVFVRTTSVFDVVGFVRGFSP
jgi:hypothetical protein